MPSRTHLASLTSALVLSGCIFSAGGDGTVNNTTPTNNQTAATNNGTVNTTGGTTDNNTTGESNNRTTSTNNGTASTNNGTSSTNNSTSSTNNGTQAMCPEDGLALELCDRSTTDPSVPLCGVLPLPDECPEARCGACAADACRGNLCLPEQYRIIQEVVGLGRTVAAGVQYVAFGPPAGDAADPQNPAVIGSNGVVNEVFIAPGQPGDERGAVVETTRDWFFSSAPGRDGGVVEVYKAADSTGFNELQITPTFPSSPNARFGAALAAGHNVTTGTSVVFVGAPEVNHVENWYALVGQEQWNRGDDGLYHSAAARTADSQYGAALAVDRDVATLVIGAPGENRAFVMFWDGTSWIDGAVLSPDGVGGSFGAVLAIDDAGDLIAVGDPATGRVEVFRRGPMNGFDQGVVLEPGKSGVPDVDGFGKALAVFPGILVVGAPDSNRALSFGGGPAAGYIFIGAIEPPSSTSGNFGAAIAQYDRRLVISGPAPLSNPPSSIIWVGAFDSLPSSSP